MRKLIGGVLSVALFSHVVNGQLLTDKVMPPSSNAAAIIKYCDHPVGTKAGIPKIRIPFRTLAGDGVFVPISLNYHSLGVRVEEEATWTGLGWYLNAGGMITRIVRGKNDFGLVEEELNPTAKGYPFEDIKPCFDDCDENETSEFHTKVCNGEIDTDPDIFFFDIMGIRGKFLLTPHHDKSSELILINIISPMKYTFAFNTSTNNWQVTDRRGYKYFFGTRELTETHRNYFDHKLESHKVLFKYYSELATTSWYLDRVVAPNGATAYLNYDVNENGVSEYASNGAHHKMNINDQDVWDVHYSAYCFPENIDNVQILSESLYNDVYLSSIVCGDYEARFTLSGREDIISPAVTDRPRPAGSQYTQYLSARKPPQKLDMIEIRKGSELIGKYEFNYSYFNEGRSDSIPRLYKRLRLDSLVTTNQKGEVKTDKFYYHQKYNLPSKESHARDLWGYYNGEEDIHNITPSDYFNYSQPEKTFLEDGRAKHYSIDHVKEGVLEKIEYGNGAVFKYQYGHQEFTNVSDEIKKHFEGKMKDTNFNHLLHPFISGGLRVEEINEKYPSDEIYKEYQYLLNNVESGVLNITHYNHDHTGYGHRTSGNHNVIYKNVFIKTGKVFKGVKF